MNNSRTKYTLINISSSIVLQLINMIVGFLIPQLFLTQYGSAYYGLISSIQQILAYFTIFEAGIGTASIFALYKSFAEYDIKKTNEILVSAKKFYNKAALLYTIGLIIMAATYPLIIKDEIDRFTIVSLVLIMGASGIIEYMIQAKHRLLLTADQKLSVLNNFISVSQLASLLVRVVLIILNYDIVVVQLAWTIINLIRSLLVGIYVRKKYPDIDYSIKTKTYTPNQKNAVLMQQISGLVVYNSPILILTLFTDLKTVSVYAVYNFVFSSLYGILTNTFSNAAVASFGNLILTRDRNSLLNVYSIYEYAYYILTTIIYTITSIMLIPFIRLYTFGISDAQYIDNRLAILFIIIGILNNIRVPMITMINAKGMFEQTQYRALTEAIINVTVSLWLVKWLGIYGVLLGTVISFLYRTTDMIFYSNKKILEQTSFITLRRITLNVVLGTLIFICIETLFDNTLILIDSWLLWISISLVVTIIAATTIIVINYLIEPKTCKRLLAKVVSLKK